VSAEGKVKHFFMFEFVVAWCPQRDRDREMSQIESIQTQLSSSLESDVDLLLSCDSGEDVEYFEQKANFQQQLTSTYVHNEKNSASLSLSSEICSSRRNLSSLFKLISLISSNNQLESHSPTQLNNNNNNNPLNNTEQQQQGQNSYENLFNQLNSLYDDFAKLKLDLILNELKLEIKYLIEDLKSSIRAEFSAKLSELVYEQSLVNAKLASIECKMTLSEEGRTSDGNETNKRQENRQASDLTESKQSSENV
jgi:hypothetical protein